MKYSVRIIGEAEEFRVEAEEVQISGGVIQFLDRQDCITALISADKLISVIAIEEAEEERKGIQAEEFNRRQRESGGGEFT